MMCSDISIYVTFDITLTTLNKHLSPAQSPGSTELYSCPKYACGMCANEAKPLPNEPGTTAKADNFKMFKHMKQNTQKQRNTKRNTTHTTITTKNKKQQLI